MTDPDCADGCADAVDVLYEYLDGELTPQRRTEILAHLEACAPCFDAFEFEHDLRTVIASHCRTEVPEKLRNRIQAEIERTSTARRG